MPKVTFSCPRCHRAYSLDMAYAGRAIDCACGATMTVPPSVIAPARLDPTPAPKPFPKARRPGRWFRFAASLSLVFLLLACGFLGGLHWADWRGRQEPVVAKHRAAPPGNLATASELQRIALAYAKRYANDPRDLEVVEWREPRPVPAGFTCPGDTAIFAMVRARNGLGALTMHQMLFYFRNKVVVHLSDSDTDVLWVYEMGTIYQDRAPNPLGDFAREMAK